MAKKKTNNDTTVVFTSLGRVALNFNVSPDTVKTWRSQGMPGEPGHYPMPEICEWLRSDGPWADRKKYPPTESDDPLLDGDSPALERYRLAKAKHAELDLEARKSELIERDKCRDVLARWATVIRRMGERLAKRHGKDAATSVNRSLEECERIIKKELGDD